MQSSMLLIDGPVVNSFVLKWKCAYVKSHDFPQYFVLFEKFWYLIWKYFYAKSHDFSQYFMVFENF